MIGQRAPGAAPAVRAVAEALPFGDGCLRRRARGAHGAPLGRCERGLRGDAARRPPGDLLLRTGDDRRLWFVTDYFPEILDLPPSTAPGCRARLLANSRRRARRSRCPYRPTASTASAAATGTGPRRTSIPTCRPASRRSRSSIPRRGPRHRAASARPGVGRVGRAPRRSPRRYRDRRRLSIGRRREYPDRHAAPGAAEGLAGAGDAATVRRRRPRGRALLRRRLPRARSTIRASSTSRSCGRRRSRATSPTGCSTSASPAATGSRRPASTSSTLTQLHYSKATARPFRIVLAVAGDSTVAVGQGSPARRARADRVPRADAAVPREARRRRRDLALVRRDRGEDPRDRRRGGRDHRDRPRAARRRARRCSTRSSCRTPS